MSTAKNANAGRAPGEVGKTNNSTDNSSTRGTIHVGLLVEWLVIGACCIGLLIVGVVL